MYAYTLRPQRKIAYGYDIDHVDGHHDFRDFLLVGSTPSGYHYYGHDYASEIRQPLQSACENNVPSSFSCLAALAEKMDLLFLCFVIYKCWNGPPDWHWMKRKPDTRVPLVRSMSKPVTECRKHWKGFQQRRLISRTATVPAAEGSRRGALASAPNNGALERARFLVV